LNHQLYETCETDEANCVQKKKETIHWTSCLHASTRSDAG
jgi:hypothetical protein